MTGKTLWHYTCKHGAERIGRVGLAVPAASLIEPERTDMPPWGRLVWFTDLVPPIRGALGLTSEILDCDRTEFRYRVTDETDVFPWVNVRTHPALKLTREALEVGPDVRPRHWFVSARPVPVRRDNYWPEDEDETP